MNHTIRVRFAPSPTGLMHLGSVRTALFNYLFAKRYNGTFILRIEDTDQERNFDPGAKQIIADLMWLKLHYDEGPHKSTTAESYFQSERIAIYQQHLDFLKTKKMIYRCFCSVETLEKKRQRQIALKQPPRYDRTCFVLSETDIENKLNAQLPFIWRFKINENQTVHFQDLARGTMTFDLNHFSDFPLTRADGTFTFLFANCVDDIAMRISHILRGEDHLSNTANQVVLYEAFNAKVPIFWHQPILCNTEGKKLSKRDFGFSLKDLQEAGYLPEAICNYLAIIGGSYEKEIMSLEELVQIINFDKLPSVSTIRYDVQKLNWVNQQWIMRISDEEFIDIAKPFVFEFYPEAKKLTPEKLQSLILSAKSGVKTIKEVPHLLQYYFKRPTITPDKIAEFIPETVIDQLRSVIKELIPLADNPELFQKTAKKMAQELNIPIKSIFSCVRLLLSGTVTGSTIHDMLTLLESREVKDRLNAL